MTKSLTQLRRDAKNLRKKQQAGDTHALQRITNYPPRRDGATLKHADYLHVIARENSFPSWPALKFAADMLGMDKATKRQRLKLAVTRGHFSVSDQLLNDTPDLAQGDFAIGHADNVILGKWLLEKGANPNDDESLYHATELGHHRGLQMLLSHGANPKGTNALLRAMDFHDCTAVQMLIDHGARVDDFDGSHVGGEAPWVVPALHQAARRMAGTEMITLLMDNGANVNRRFEGATPYAYARVFGNAALARLLEERGADTTLTRVETALAAAAEGPTTHRLSAADVPDAYRNIIRMILHLPGKLGHVRRLVALGIENDRPDTEGLTPVQVAGWEGLPDRLAYLLSLKPDLDHVNSYGGTLLSTILHGSENCPQRQDRDYISCLELALQAGVLLPRRAVELTGDSNISEFLLAWAEQHPAQVVEGGAA